MACNGLYSANPLFLTHTTTATTIITIIIIIIIITTTTKTAKLNFNHSPGHREIRAVVGNASRTRFKQLCAET